MRHCQGRTIFCDLTNRYGRRVPYLSRRPLYPMEGRIGRSRPPPDACDCYLNTFYRMINIDHRPCRDLAYDHIVFMTKSYFSTSDISNFYSNTFHCFWGPDWERWAQEICPLLLWRSQVDRVGTVFGERWCIVCCGAFSNSLSNEGSDIPLSEAATLTLDKVRLHFPAIQAPVSSVNHRDPWRKLPAGDEQGSITSNFFVTLAFTID